MLIEKIDACTSSMNELSTLRANALSLNAYEAAVNQLTPVDATITEFVATVEEMNKHDFCKMNLSAEDIDKMRDAIKTCAEAVNLMSLNNNDVAAITSVFKSQKTILTALWNSAAKAYVTPIRSYLGIIQTFAANKDDIANLSKNLNTGSAAEPVQSQPDLSGHRPGGAADHQLELPGGCGVHLPQLLLPGAGQRRLFHHYLCLPSDAGAAARCLPAEPYRRCE